MTDVPVIQLKKGEDRRLRVGHLWVFSNEIDTGVTPLSQFEPGQEVVVLGADRRPLGAATVNPHSLIAARLYSRNPEQSLDVSLITHRLNVALSLRRRLYRDDDYRLVFGESDALPGLVVDRYDDHLVVQLTTAGMDVRREAIVAALEKVVKPAGILLRNDVPLRELEGLEQKVEVVSGSVPDTLEVGEGGLRFRFDPHRGQKTGWFFDQRDNRDWLVRVSEGARVLDLFSYAGAWGLRAAAAGAKAVTLVDVSAPAVAGIEDNIRLNGLEDRCRAIRADAFDFLRDELAGGERYDLVVLDPPAFVKRKKDLKQGAQAYRRLNEMALRLLDRDGLLVTCSCSYHMPEAEFVRGLQQAARHVDRQLEILASLQQGPDHPVHPAIPETRYLKGVLVRATPTP